MAAQLKSKKKKMPKFNNANMSQYVSLLKSPNYDAASIKCLTVVDCNMGLKMPEKVRDFRHKMKYIGIAARKPVFRVCDQARLKPVYPAQ